MNTLSTMLKLGLFVFIACTGLLLNGCGHKGELVLPQETQQNDFSEDREIDNKTR